MGKKISTNLQPGQLVSDTSKVHAGGATLIDADMTVPPAPAITPATYVTLSAWIMGMTLTSWPDYSKFKLNCKIYLHTYNKWYDSYATRC